MQINGVDIDLICDSLTGTKRILPTDIGSTTAIAYIPPLHNADLIYLEEVFKMMDDVIKYSGCPPEFLEQR